MNQPQQAPPVSFNLNAAPTPDKQGVLITVTVFNTTFQMVLPKEFEPHLMKALKSAFDACSPLVVAAPFAPNGNKIQ